jgi:hypothetical protein
MYTLTTCDSDESEGEDDNNEIKEKNENVEGPESEANAQEEQTEIHFPAQNETRVVIKTPKETFEAMNNNC